MQILSTLENLRREGLTVGSSTIPEFLFLFL